MSDKLVNRKEVAEAIGVKPITIGRWEKKGLPFVRIGMGKPRYDLDQVMQWMQENTEK